MLKSVGRPMMRSIPSGNVCATSHSKLNCRFAGIGTCCGLISHRSCSLPYDGSVAPV